MIRTYIIESSAGKRVEIRADCLTVALHTARLSFPPPSVLYWRGCVDDNWAAGLILDPDERAGA